MLEKTYRVLFFAFLVWAPIPIGSNRAVFWSINAVIVLGIFLLLVIDEWRNRRSRTAVQRTVVLLLALTTVPLVWMVVQALSLTPSALHSPTWADLSVADLSWSGAISVNPGATLSAASNFVTVALAGIIAARIAMSSRQTLILLNVVIASAALVAAWGIAARYMGWSQVILGSSDGTTVLTSFFVNRNTTATYLSLGLVASLALVMGRLEQSRSPNFIAAIADFPRRVGPYLLVMALIGLALLQTGSRAGIAAGGLGTIAVLILGFRRAAAESHWVVALLFVGGGILVLLFGVSAEGIIDRLTETGAVDATRWQLYADTLAAIVDRPILGFGAGTFYDFFPGYHSEALGISSGIWLEAHNTYLQSAAELGLPMFLFALGALLFLVGRFSIIAFRREDPMPGAVAGLGAAVVVGFHALFDFSLQIQSVAIIFAVLIGTGVAGPVRAQLRRRPQLPTERVARRYETFSVAPRSPTQPV
ncbi:MAG: O-antigen ligase family protein [Bauldia sp.]|nr:O-antigen ligase family protein [Bauldia sp.]MCW5717109.1 O-antigen ligase family protein [Bauldia sp.]